MKIDVSVDGRITCPDTMSKPRREIAVSRRDQYVKLPCNVFPVTCNTSPEGIGVTLRCGQYVCEAALHRRTNGEFWISTPSKRLGQKYTELYRDFLSKSKLDECGMEVKLKFQDTGIHIEELRPQS